MQGPKLSSKVVWVEVILSSQMETSGHVRPRGHEGQIVQSSHGPSYMVLMYDSKDILSTYQELLIPLITLICSNETLQEPPKTSSVSLKVTYHPKSLTSMQ